MKKPGKPSLLTWFKFRPAMFATMLMMDDAEFGRRMKEMVTNLMANQAKPGTPEAEMLAEARTAAAKWSAAAKARWLKRNGSEVADDMGPVYEEAAEMGIPDVDAAEWHHAQREKGFSQLDNWPGAMRRWAEGKAENHDL